ncbi:biotin-dependent carboxyltransferase family protein [Porcipelethomonas sp.]|uniref:5-oxoprolinase subunit C family protein n=1 Tax=Porcipelethomonas sp. TaxID=2981675 RepID=UPI003EF78CB6
MAVKILRAGPMMTVQDCGRFGFADKGVSQSGVLDYYSAACINCILGNSRNEAVIEMTMMGGDFEFENTAFFALGGADMQACLNGRECSLYTVYKAESGDVLTMGYAQKGCHGYISFSGGIDVPVVMGSRSTNMKCGIGGFNGRKLMTGDVINTGFLSCTEGISIEPEDVYGDIVHVVSGAQCDMFTQKGIDTFFSEEYTVSGNYDRMGCRLQGTAIESKNGMDIISDGIAFGSIQISSDGQPIVMLADRQTIGGYAKIGAVATADIPKFVQHKPGEKIKFEKITIKEAQKMYIRREKELNKMFRKYGRM